jgi:hypothetical protein
VSNWSNCSTSPGVDSPARQRAINAYNCVECDLTATHKRRKKRGKPLQGNIEHRILNNEYRIESQGPETSQEPLSGWSKHRAEVFEGSTHLCIDRFDADLKEFGYFFIHESLVAAEQENGSTLPWEGGNG